MDESRFLVELKFISSLLCLHKFMNTLCAKTISFFSLFSSDPLFSCIVTFCTLVFLYLPHLFCKIVFSPVIILTVTLLFTILRLGAIQKSQHERKEENQDKTEPIKEEKIRGSECKEEKQSEQSSSPTEPNESESFEQVHQLVNSQMGFMEWNVRAPLEVIYEEYEEGEEEDEAEAGDDPNKKEEKQNMGILRYPSLSRYYPESDSDSDSSSENDFPAIGGGWDSPEDICFRWDEEDREGLIEIALDGCKMKRDLEFSHFEEENLIEIDISPTRYKEFSGDDQAFSGEISCN